jgi:hypothetical protein
VYGLFAFIVVLMVIAVAWASFVRHRRPYYKPKLPSDELPGLLVGAIAAVLAVIAMIGITLGFN